MNFSRERKDLGLAAWEIDESNPVKAATAQCDNRNQKAGNADSVFSIGQFPVFVHGPDDLI